MHSFDILYEDESCAVINKPAGKLVHPVPGNSTDESVSKWWSQRDDVAKNGWDDNTRAGIVHRLDKDTSGALLLAKSPQALEYFQGLFKKRKVKKVYQAVVLGTPSPATGKIVSSIERNSKSRTHRSSRLIDFGASTTAKKAVTLYKVTKLDKVSGAEVSQVEFNIKTGRTHQIRAHAKMIGCPILGDDFYFTKPSRRLSKKLGIERQLLHARTIGFTNMDGKAVNIETPTPADIRSVLD